MEDLQATKAKQQEINDMMITTLRAAVSNQSQPVSNLNLNVSNIHSRYLVRLPPGIEQHL